jgi:transposase-like protein
MTNEYVAGLFDGEGYVGVSHQAAHDSYCLVVSVTNNHLPVLEELQGLYGGSISEPRHYGVKAGKGSWTWRAFSVDALAFLRSIEPHVIIKADQVAEALTFPIHQVGRRTTQAKRARQREIHHNLKDMKAACVWKPDGRDRLQTEALGDRDDVRAAVELYKGGMNTSETAEAIGVSQGTVSYWMRQLGVSRPRSETASMGAEDRANSIHSRPEAKRAKRLYLSGLSAAEVARQVGEKPATVNYWLRRMGVVRTLSEAQKVRRKKEASEVAP